MTTVIIVVLLAAIVVVLLWRSSAPEPVRIPAPRRLPRQRSAAPQLTGWYFEAILSAAGFPRTAHNLFAVQEQLGMMFTTKARRLIEEFGTDSDWRRFLNTARYPTSNMHLWPQRVLDGLAAWDARIVPHMQNLPERCSQALLDTAGTGSGFFGGAPDAPLWTVSERHLRELSQPNARPMAAPR